MSGLPIVSLCTVVFPYYHEAKCDNREGLVLFL